MKSKVEFEVQIKSTESIDKIKDTLKNLGHVEIDRSKQRLVIETQTPWAEVQEQIEKTGRKAVLVGFGGQAAVAIVDKGNPNVMGVVRFSSQTADPNSDIVVDGVIDGLTPGLHGLHIYETGDISEGCTSIGDHYNPRGSPHGGRDDSPNDRHAGDLGNIRADETGRSVFRMNLPDIKIWEIIGRSIAVTEQPDDLGKGSNTTSKFDGNSGARLTCGIIARAAGIAQNFKKICACDGVTLWDERNVPVAGGNRNQKTENAGKL